MLKKTHPHFTLIFHVSILISYFIAQFYIAKHNTPHIKTFIFSLMTIPIPFIIMNMGKIISTTLMAALSIILIFNVSLCIKYHLITNDMLVAISGTSINEILSVLRTVNYFSAILLGVYLFVFSRIVWQTSSLNMRNVMIGFAAMTPLIFHVNHYYISNKTLVKNSVKDTFYPNSDWYKFAWRYVMPGYIGNTYYMVAIHTDKSSSIAMHTPHTYTDKLISGKNNKRQRNIILLIGESDFSGRHNTYGYAKYTTTPFQNKMLQSQQACNIMHAHSSANLTRNAIPLILSFATPDHPKNLINTKNILELAHDNGYHTWWIGSQDYTSFADRTFSYLVDYSNTVIAPNYRRNNYNVRNNDFSLLSAIKNEFQSNEPYKFYIIHILGSHVSYSDKYDAQDAHDLPSASAYDRSIHHTDRLIERIINLANNELKDYVLFYTPDHGEIVKSGETINIGHGLQYGGYDQYDIPILIAGYNHEEYCKILNTLRQKDGYYTEIMDKVFLSQIMGYSINQDNLQDIKVEDRVLHSDGKVYDFNKIPYYR